MERMSLKSTTRVYINIFFPFVFGKQQVSLKHALAKRFPQAGFSHVKQSNRE